MEKQKQEREHSRSTEIKQNVLFILNCLPRRSDCCALTVTATKRITVLLLLPAWKKSMYQLLPSAGLVLLSLLSNFVEVLCVQQYYTILLLVKINSEEFILPPRCKWDAMQRRLLGSYRRFGATYQSHLQGLSSRTRQDRSVVPKRR